MIRRPTGQRFDAALLRSAWDYTERLAEFLAWVERTAAVTTLLNPAPVVRWNSDKHYLRTLARRDCRWCASAFVEPDEDAAAALEQFLARDASAELVVKPAVGAGSRDTRRHARAAVPAMLAHMRDAAGRAPQRAAAALPAERRPRRRDRAHLYRRLPSATPSARAPLLPRRCRRDAGTVCGRGHHAAGAGSR